MSSTSGSGRFYDAIANLDARVFALHRVLPALEGRSGRTHDHHCPGKFGTHYGNIARVVARRLLLLVALVVLFVNENEAEILTGAKIAERVPTTIEPLRDECAAIARCVLPA